ncbi:PLP-dependent aminotransferase family protein [Yersinia enterocolitica]|uniref:aminotransferase-like domain-containing protein n=1 Tax=Yersinia enterocolitica TaxID=630 RepID=UPI001EFD1ADC|nr:PLP-dependent aminotransferase family protein [Yersinia enterocolitica]EKN3635923.1 PLP-dependent aminotransferase family protein [Yersinia enterocolitica]EKN3686413.1 PLP-dependent aminotransferase family protein [Yersinia enterocolitica]EKN3714541.1 PLP-dependent aminotransferase family protein [Yersinia enterocolitica]EKN4880980.1 PLP-dependent aminotransferase family protein [Yersinia enterocolitica]EKN6091127.1 PLP-dependent aminotransferase family protein [Yersinia enterocolitica]
MTRYEQLAQQIRAQIQSKVWQAGDKLPSLRESCKQSGLSLMTVVQSYQLLESQGWIVARPQSGYYVASRPTQLPQPQRGKKLHLDEQVDINTFIFDVLQAGKDPAIMPFGSAFPDPSLLLQPRLSRALAGVARKISPQSSVTNLPPGNESLRRNIAQRYAASGMNVSPEEIVITAGAMESLSLSLQAVTQPGDWVVIESPAFYGALQAIERLRLKAIAITTHPQNGMDLDALEQVISQYPIKACWLMTHFQNPLGSTMSWPQKKRLVALLQQNNISLIEDDVYGELYFGAERPLPAKALDQHRQILHCSSFSKCLAPGFRVGWVAAGEHAQRVQHLQLMSTVSASVPTQLAIADYLSQGGYDTHLRRLRRMMEQRLNALRQAVVEHFPKNVKISHPSGGYFLWLELEPPFNASELYRRALAQGVSIAPGRMFTTGNQFDHCFRLNASFTWSEQSEKAIRILAMLITQLTSGVDNRSR